jgi:hypothetical protein
MEPEEAAVTTHELLVQRYAALVTGPCAVLPADGIARLVSAHGSTRMAAAFVHDPDVLVILPDDAPLGDLPFTIRRAVEAGARLVGRWRGLAIFQATPAQVKGPASPAG